MKVTRMFIASAGVLRPAARPKLSTIAALPAPNLTRPARAD